MTIKGLPKEYPAAEQKFAINVRRLEKTLKEGIKTELYLLAIAAVAEDMVNARVEPTWWVAGEFRSIRRDMQERIADKIGQMVARNAGLLPEGVEEETDEAPKRRN